MLTRPTPLDATLALEGHSCLLKSYCSNGGVNFNLLHEHFRIILARVCGAVELRFQSSNHISISITHNVLHYTPTASVMLTCDDQVVKLLAPEILSSRIQNPWG